MYMCVYVFTHVLATRYVRIQTDVHYMDVRIDICIIIIMRIYGKVVCLRSTIGYIYVCIYIYIYKLYINIM